MSHIESYKGTKDRWRLFVSVPKGRDGSRRRLTEIVDGTKAEARRRLRELESGLETGAVVPAAARSLRDFVEAEWWPAKLAKLSPTTLRSYRVLLDRHILPALGDQRLQRVEPRDVARLTGGMVADGHATQAQRCHVLLGTLWRAAVRSGATGRNIVEVVEAPRPHRREMVALTPDQVKAVLDDLAGRQSWAFRPVAILFTTGIRRSELVGLRWADFDGAAGLLHIRRAAHILKGGEWAVRQSKSARSRRAVALDRRSVEMLEAQRRESEGHASLFGRTLTPDCPIFAPPSQAGLGLEGRPWRNDVYSRLWWRTAKRLGIRARLYDARHTSASILIASGAHLRLVSERLGHSSASFTADRYVHVMPGQQHEAAEQLAKALGGALPALAAG
jgi:integrase